MPEQYANKAQTTLNNGGTLSSGAISLVVTSATAFPSSGTFRIIIDSEIIIVGAVSGTTFSSLTRGAESTTAVSHADGSLVTFILTLASLRVIPDYVATAGSDMTGALGLPSYTFNGLPTPGLAGRIARTSDGSRGLWMDTGSYWYSLFGNTHDVHAYGAKGDVAQGADGATTSGSAVFTSAAGPFTSADVGKSIGIVGGGSSRTSSADGAIASGSKFLTATASFAQTDVGGWLSIPGAGAAGATLITRVMQYIATTCVQIEDVASTTVTGKTVTLAQPLITTISAYTSATQITLGTNASSTVTGALYTFGTDDRAAIQAAIDAVPFYGGEVFLPENNYWINSVINITGNGVHIKGSGERTTGIYLGFQSDDGFAFGNGTATPSDCSIEGMSITGVGARSGGAAIHVRNAHNFYAAHLRLTDFHWIGFLLEGGDSQFGYNVRDFEINRGNYGIYIGNPNQSHTVLSPQDVWCTHGLVGGTTYGFYISEASGVYLTDVDTINTGQYGFLMQALTGKLIVFVFCNRVLIDSNGYGVPAAYADSRHGWYLTGSGTGRISGVFLEQCWGSSSSPNGASVGFLADFAGDGLTSGVFDVSLVGCEFIANGGNGVWFSGPSHWTMIGCQVLSNSQVSANAHHGIRVSSGSSYWIFSNNRSGRGAGFTNNQGYGILLDSAGGANNYIIQGCDLSGNLAGGILDLAVGTTRQIIGNLPSELPHLDGSLDAILTGPSSQPVADWTLIANSYTSIVSDTPLVVASGYKIALPSGSVLDLLPDMGVDAMLENSDLNQDLVIPTRRQLVIIGPYIVESNNMLWLADSSGSAILSIVP